MLMIKGAMVTHLEPRISDDVLRHGCAAVWVYCGDKEKCLGSYKECWLKHLVRELPFIDHIDATDQIEKSLVLHVKAGLKDAREEEGMQHDGKVCSRSEVSC